MRTVSILGLVAAATLLMSPSAFAQCTNTCVTANDGECDDGGLDSLYSICDLGTDCNDCGARGAVQGQGSANPTQNAFAGEHELCSDTCGTSHDGECDDGGPDSLYSICDFGTDCADCGPRQSPGADGGATWWRDPTFGAIDLASGFTPDPWAHEVTAGGGSNPQNVRELGYYDAEDGTRCVGYVTRSPDFRFNYTAGEFPFLRFYTRMQDNADAMLLINDPHGNWRCNDDSHGTLQATIDFSKPESGQYDVWIGSYDASSGNPGHLMITELEANHP